MHRGMHTVLEGRGGVCQSIVRAGLWRGFSVAKEVESLVLRGSWFLFVSEERVSGWKGNAKRGLACVSDVSVLTPSVGHPRMDCVQIEAIVCLGIVIGRRLCLDELSL
jgi:hypothetical protein